MRILVALDGSPLAEHALEVIGPMASQTKSEVVLLTVLDPGDIHATAAEWGHRVPDFDQSIARSAMRGAIAEPPRALAEDRGQAMTAARNAAEDAMRAAAEKWLPEGLRWSVHVEWSGDTVDAIADYAATQKASLVAVGAHGRSGLSEVLLGSVTTGLVRKSSVPLIVIGHDMKRVG
jgi:nucleotide-binding universal stress UspA family protein